jgi:predicted outer membrane protein
VQRTAASQDAVDLAQLSVIPTSSVVSHQVLADWERDRSQLQVPLPSEFDRVFIDHHVTRDLRAVALLDAAIDEARSPALRAHLQSDRTTIAGHMREAQRLQLILRSPGP